MWTWALSSPCWVWTLWHLKPPFPFVVVRRKRGFPKSLWIWWGILSTSLLWSGGNGLQWLVMAFPWMPKESRVEPWYPAMFVRSWRHVSIVALLSGCWVGEGHQWRHQHQFLSSGKSLQLLASDCPLLERCLNLQEVYSLLITLHLKNGLTYCCYKKVFHVFLQE